MKNFIMGPGRLKPSDSAPVLQCGSGLSSDFLAKVLVVYTPLFLYNTQFNFPISLLLVRLIKVCALTLWGAVQLVECLPTLRAAGVQFSVR
jgi:hypothetical protein